MLVSAMAIEPTRTVEGIGATVQQFTISQSDLPAGEPHRIRTPIPVNVTCEASADFVASFDQARISIGGESFDDAFGALVIELLDVFDYLTEHRAELGAEPERQLSVLSRYIAKPND
jgi:hypothetical protein